VGIGVEVDMMRCYELWCYCAIVGFLSVSRAACGSSWVALEDF